MNHLRILCTLLLTARFVPAMAPVVCPAGAPLGSFQLAASPASGSTPRPIQTVNQLLPGYTVSYTPAAIDSPDRKKARIALVLVPSDHGKLVVFDPKPAAEAAEWKVDTRTQIVSLIFGPRGLNKGKVSQLLAKNEELAGQLADYAQKTQQTEALIKAITQDQQALDTGQNVNAAVLNFANQFPTAPRIDRTQPADQQLLTIIRGVNPALSTYDPLAASPSQRAAQSAGLAAAVAGLFFGTNVGLAASGGALLVNMHSLLFPGTEFRSAFVQPVPDHKSQTALCGNKTPSASRTELAFLWATRLPDSGPPELALPKPQHLPIGAKSTFPITITAREASLAARVQDWRLVLASDEKLAAAVHTQVNTEAKTVELDLTDPKLKPGAWKLVGNWDWTPLSVAGEIDLHEFSRFDKAHLTADSQDRLTQGSGKVLVNLEGGDFEFVEKLAFKHSDDKFATPASLSFSLPKGPRAGPESTLETQIDTAALTAGNYKFLIAQTDGKAHEVPFKVLPAPPLISNLPLIVNTGGSSQPLILRGNGLDRIEQLSADHTQITLGTPDKGDERLVTIRLDSELKKGTRLTLHMKVKDFENTVGLTDALLVAGPRPAITSVRPSLPSDLGIALLPGEMPANSPVSFALDVNNSPKVARVNLACNDTPHDTTSHDTPAVSVKAGESQGSARLRQESPSVLFLTFDPQSVGPPGCDVEATIVTAGSGSSMPKELGRIVRLPTIDSFQLTDEKVNNASAFYGVLKGQNLEEIEKVGWDPASGTPVDAIPAPVAGAANEESLRIAVPWPASAPHAPLYVWLRGEQTGRATAAKW